jgi:hypothetical protein
MSFFANGRKALKPEDVKICVLYDPKDGRIAHHHVVATFAGGHKVDNKEVERRTLKRAANFGTDTSKLKALHVSEKDCDPSHRYKVNIKTLTLIELPNPEFPGSKGGAKNPRKQMKRGKLKSRRSSR